MSEGMRITVKLGGLVLPLVIEFLGAHPGYNESICNKRTLFHRSGLSCVWFHRLLGDHNGHK